MKNTLFLLVLILASCTSKTNETPEVTASADFYLGSWALDLNYPDFNVGYLEVRQEENYLDADLLWRWGSVGPAEFVFINQGHLMVSKGRDIVREKDADGKAIKTHHAIWWLQIQKSGENEIEGLAVFPNHNGLDIETIAFKGKRVPAPEKDIDMSKIAFGNPIELLNGTDLTGWELLDPTAVNGWSVKDGILVNDPVQKEGEAHINYGNLKTTAAFEDFNLKLQVAVPEGSNSGIYLRGIYEIQVYDSYGKELDSHNMGALYSRITPSVAAEKPAGEWQDLDITLYKRHLTVILNGTPIIDNQFVKGVTGGAMSSDEFAPGPIYLQGDHGTVMYRNLVLTPIE